MISHSQHTKLGNQLTLALLGSLFALANFIVATNGYAAVDPTVLPGFDDGVGIEGRGIHYSSPIIAEIDGDLTNGKEIAVSTPDGILDVVHSDGSPLWSVRLPSASCSLAKLGDRASGSPAVGALFGNGVPYVVVSYGSMAPSKCDGGVIAFRGRDGALAWNFNTRSFAKKEKYGSTRFGVFSTPALADVDFDGKLEIGFGGLDRNIYLLNANGSVRWYYRAADTSLSSPTFANVDGDRNLEMIVATDISKNDKLKPPTKNGGFIYALKTNALTTRSKRLGFRNNAINKANPKEFRVWQTYLDQVLYSSPVVADVLPSNPGSEVVIQSGCQFKSPKGKYLGNWIKVLSLQTGQILTSIPTSACSSSTPAVADIDHDGQLEIIASTNGSKSFGGDGFSRLSAWKAQNPIPIWSMIPYGTAKSDSRGGDFKSPVIGDLDGNGSLEVVVANNRGLAIVSAASGMQLNCPQNYHTCLGLGQFNMGLVTNNTPAIGDVDGDGKLDLVAGGGDSDIGAIYAWTDFDMHLGSTPDEAGEPNAVPWSMWSRNAN